MRIPHVQQSLVDGRPHTSHVTTSCVPGSQWRPRPSNSSSKISSPPGAWTKRSHVVTATILGLRWVDILAISRTNAFGKAGTWGNHYGRVSGRLPTCFGVQFMLLNDRVADLCSDAADIAKLQLLRPCVVYCALLRVRQGLESPLDAPEDDCVAAFVRMVNFGEAPEGLRV